MTFLPRLTIVLLALSLGCAGLPSDAGAADTPLQRRNALNRAASSGPASVGRLRKGLDDPSPVVRRTAVRLLAETGAPAREALLSAMDHDDVVIRRAALAALCTLDADPVPHLAHGMTDPDAAVRVMAVRRLAAITPRPKAVYGLLEKARQDKSPEVSRIAGDAMWPFKREVTLIRDRTDHDYNVDMVKTIKLPKTGWKFTTDPKRNGHIEGYFKPGFDDTGWRDFEIEKAWQKQGVDYTGVVWYRRTIELPAKPEHVAVELHFGGVDESTWVWVNGIYVGSHDIGPDGWNKPFALDITKELKWGEKNQVTVRAMNTAAMGGIWRPVHIEVLK